MALIFNPNLKVSTIMQKIKLLPKDVNIQYVSSRVMGNDYRTDFLIQINPSQALKDPSTIVSKNNVDLVTLRNSILDKLTPMDRHYMVLKEFDTIRASFYFDIPLWLHDAMNMLKPLTQLTQFNRTFKFRVSLPPMVLKEPLRSGLQELLIRRFRNYLDANPSTKSWFVSLFPKGVQNPLHRLVSDRFNYTYNFQSNMITMALKPFWITALIYALAQYSKISKEKERIKKLQNPGDFFTAKTKSYFSKFDNPTLKSYMKDKFI